MTVDEIIAIANDAGCDKSTSIGVNYVGFNTKQLERFVELITTKERERCLMVAAHTGPDLDTSFNIFQKIAGQHTAGYADKLYDLYAARPEAS